MSIEVVVTFALASPLQYHDPLAHIYDASFGEIPDDKFTFLCLPHLQTPIVPRKSIDTHTISETTCKYRSITAVTHTQMTARHVGYRFRTPAHVSPYWDHMASCSGSLLPSF